MGPDNDFQDLPNDGICHVGNFFIMDSEQLVSNPYLEMQNEAISDYNAKRSSHNEKFTAVKNNVCENHFAMAQSQLDREKDSRLRHLHEDASKLRYEVKLLDLSRRKNEIELRKRIEPKRDFSYDDNQVDKSERRLGANIESHYLDRKLRYPVRAKIVSDIAITPIVAKARTTLKQKQRPESERAITAKSVISTVVEELSPMRATRRKWPPSHSAPLTASSASSHRKLPDNKHSRFPDIRQNFDGRPQQQQRLRGLPQRVKFAFESPHNLIVPSEAGNSLEYLPRSYTYHEGMGKRPGFFHDSHSSETDNDDEHPSESVDLRAIFFGKSKEDDNVSLKSHPPSAATFTPHLRRTPGVTPQQTQEKLLKETKDIQGKIEHFLYRLETDPPIKKPGMDGFDSDEEIIIEPKVKIIPPFINRNKPWTPIPKPVEPPSAPTANSDDKDGKENAEDDKDEKSSEKSEKRDVKNAWKFIRGHARDGTLRGTYSAADLVLQQLTGVLIGHGQGRITVPLHAASRAMRHTATFKMRKVVEALIGNRTRYEQHKVDELKKKMDGDGVDGEGGDGGEVQVGVATGTVNPGNDVPQEVS